MVFCGLNSVHPSKEGVNVLPVSHPCESHPFNLMRKLTAHCDQQSLSCSASPRSYKTASFALTLEYLQLGRMETEGTQLNLKQDAFLSDLTFTIDRGTQTSLTGYTRHLAAWQSFVPHRDQSKQGRDLSGKRGISCFLLLQLWSSPLCLIPFILLVFPWWEISPELLQSILT